MEPTSLVIDIPAGPVAALAWGDPGMPPVLALHGWLDNAASFVPLAPRLGGVRLIVPDLPGHGLSAHRPQGAAYHFSDYVSDMVDLVEQLGWTRFDVIGHSLGGAIAAFLASVLPDRVRRLALIESLGPLSGEPEEEPRRFRRALRQRRYAVEGHGYASLEAAVEARMRRGLSATAARLLAERGTYQSGDQLYWRHDNRAAARSPIYLTEEQVLAFLGGIEADTLLLEAEEGLLATWPGHERRCSRIARLQRHRLPGNHHLHMENPERVAAVLTSFLRPSSASPVR